MENNAMYPTTTGDYSAEALSWFLTLSLLAYAIVTQSDCLGWAWEWFDEA